MVSETFGGYLPLELPATSGHFYPQARRYSSARNALYHLLVNVQPARLWLPRMICHSVSDAVKAAGVDIVWYSLTEEWLPEGQVELNSDDLLFYVNYYGQCGDQQQQLLQQYPAEQIIFDHAQAFYAEALPALATLYSPRKFFGIPDGGLLICQPDLAMPDQQDRESVHHAQHLLLQYGFDSASGFQAYRQAEEHLDTVSSLRMSSFTNKLLQTVDYGRVCQQRTTNYQRLQQAFKGVNQLALADGNIQGAFCYPLLLPEKNYHAELIARGVFVATYWAEVLGKVAADSLEAKWVNKLIPLPCDQRYSPAQIERLIEIVMDVIA